jgi:glycosyltransferase involved in cell wall biosynthesis
MRILIASDQWFPDFKGGSARVVTETAQKLAERGHTVTVLAPRVDGKKTEQAVGPMTVRKVFARNRLPITFTDVLETRRFARRTIPAGFDVLLGHQSTTSSGLWAARLGVPLVRVFHASAPMELRFSRSRLKWGPARLAAYGLAPTLDAWEALSLSRASRIIVLSEFSRSILLEAHPQQAQKVRRVTGGVDADFFSPGDGQVAAREKLGVPVDLPLLVTVRRLESRMGVRELIQALKLIENPKDVRLAIVGAGTLRTELEQLSARLGLEAQVRFTGRVEDSELRDWYRAADLFVLPTVALEGFGMVTAEALSTGTPVVGTPVGATPELLRPLDPRLVTESSDPEALAATISQVLEITGSAYRRRCREYACTRFDWKSAIEGWERALLEAAAHGST